MSDKVIEVKNVRKTFLKSKGNGIFDLLKNRSNYKNNKLVALNDISFSVSKGEMLGVIGLNGSGKTTLLRIISGIYIPDSGTVTVQGKIAPLLQIGTGFQNEYVAKENITMYGLLMGLTKSEIEAKIDDIIEYAELKEFSNMKLKHYSAGMRSKLAFSTALQINPDILLVDEILAVGDAAFREKSFNSFLSFKKNRKTIIYSTHNLSMIPKLCDKVLLLNKGNLISIGEPEEVLRTYKEIINQKARTSK